MIGNELLLFCYSLANGRNWFSIAQFVPELENRYKMLIWDGYLEQSKSQNFPIKHHVTWRWNFYITPKGFEKIEQLKAVTNDSL